MHACLHDFCVNRSEYERTKCWIQEWTSGFQVTSSFLSRKWTPVHFKITRMTRVRWKKLDWENWEVKGVQCVKFGLLYNITDCSSCMELNFVCWCFSQKSYSLSQDQLLFSQCACSFSLFLLLNASLPLRIFMWLYYTGAER